MSATQWQTVRIKLDDHDKGEIWIDDMELKYTLGVEFHSNPGGPPIVTIKMPANVEYEGAAIVEYEFGRWMKAGAIESGEVTDDGRTKGMITPEGDEAWRSS